MQSVQNGSCKLPLLLGFLPLRASCGTLNVPSPTSNMTWCLRTFSESWWARRPLDPGNSRRSRKGNCASTTNMLFCWELCPKGTPSLVPSFASNDMAMAKSWWKKAGGVGVGCCCCSCCCDSCSGYHTYPNRMMMMMMMMMMMICRKPAACLLIPVGTNWRIGETWKKTCLKKHDKGTNPPCSTLWAARHISLALDGQASGPTVSAKKHSQATNGWNEYTERNFQIWQNPQNQSWLHLFTARICKNNA